MSDSHFGKNLKKLRESQGKSQMDVVREMQDRFGDRAISQTYLSKLEKSVHTPKRDTLQVICDYFGMTHFEIIIGADEPISRELLLLHEKINGLLVLHIKTHGTHHVVMDARQAIRGEIYALLDEMENTILQIEEDDPDMQHVYDKIKTITSQNGIT